QSDRAIASTVGGNDVRGPIPAIPPEPRIRSRSIGQDAGSDRREDMIALVLQIVSAGTARAGFIFVVIPQQLPRGCSVLARFTFDRDRVHPPGIPFNGCAEPVAQAPAEKVISVEVSNVIGREP